MRRRTFAVLTGFLVACTLRPGLASAQSVCDLGNGPLDSVLPSNTTAAEIIQAFAAKEQIFEAARDRYAYTEQVTVQSVDSHDRVDGKFRQISEATINSHGKRVEKTTFAPPSTLRRLAMTQEDIEDIRERLPVALTPKALSLLSVSYLGKQQADAIDTYVFDASPRDPKKQTKLFRGRIWVDDQSLTIVKTCGWPREDEYTYGPRGYPRPNLVPVFLTSREQVDQLYWFPASSRADGILQFPRGPVHIRAVVTYSNYRLLPPK